MSSPQTSASPITPAPAPNKSVMWLARAAMGLFVLVTSVVLTGLTFLLLSVRRQLAELRETVLGDNMAPQLMHAIYEFLATPRHRNLLIEELQTHMHYAQADAAS